MFVWISDEFIDFRLNLSVLNGWIDVSDLREGKEFLNKRSGNTFTQAGFDSNCPHFPLIYWLELLCFSQTPVRVPGHVPAYSRPYRRRWLVNGLVCQEASRFAVLIGRNGFACWIVAFFLASKCLCRGTCEEPLGSACSPHYRQSWEEPNEDILCVYLCRACQV